MSILDDAIREHLELKRAHGADDSELKRLEDEAFGPPQRPDEVDPFAEAPTEFLVSPDETPAPIPEIADESARSGRRPDIADLQEAPPAPSGEPAPFDAPAPGNAPDRAGEPPAGEPGAAAEPESEELAPLPDAPPPSPADAAAVPLPPPVDEAPAAAVPAPPADEAPAAVTPPADEAPADVPPPTPADEAPSAEEPSAPGEPTTGEGEIVADTGPNTEERHAIADQPTQMFDVQAHVDAEADEAPAAEQASPTDEELVDAVQGEPQAAPPASDELFTVAPGQESLDLRGPDAEVAGHPPAEAEPTEEESAEYDFFNEQRLSDELDQALEAPLPPTDEHIAMPRYDDAPPAQGGIFDFESDERYEEDPSEEVLRRHDAPEPPSEEYDPPSEELEPPSEETPHASAEQPSEEVDAYDPDTGHSDVLEDTPRFLEDADDDELWFEQKPPKDFDL